MSEPNAELQERLKSFTKEKLEEILDHLKSRNLENTAPYHQFNGLYKRLTGRNYIMIS